MFEGEQLDGLVEDFDRIVAQLEGSGESVDARWNGAAMDALDGGSSRIVHTHNVQQYSARWLAAFTHPPLLDVTRALLGPDVLLHHSKLFCKPPRAGSPFPLHQDWSYFPTERDSMIACVIHLSEADEESGCLRTVPGSHRRGRVSGSSGQAESSAPFAWDESVPHAASPGDVLFFHCFTYHGSGPNRSAHARKTVLAQLMSGGDRLEDPSGHPHEDLVLSGFHSGATRSSAGRAK